MKGQVVGEPSVEFSTTGLKAAAKKRMTVPNRVANSGFVKEMFELAGGHGLAKCRGKRSVLYQFLLYALCLVTFAGVSWAQISTSGTISGTITDSTGAVVPQAAISVINQLTKLETHAVSNGGGGFALSGLQPGPYDVSITGQGFETFKEAGVVLSPAQVVTVNAVLTAGAVTTTVNVAAAAAQVETSTSEVSSQVSAEQIGTLPLNGRNYQSLAFLMPGVTNVSPDTAQNQGGFLTNNVVSVNGMSVQGTQYYVDGIWNENTGDMSQTTITPNPDTIEEVRLLQNNFGVEYALNDASAMVVQTKSGTKDFHGSAFEYFRNDALDARNYFSGPSVPALKQSIYGYTVGGPVTIPGHFNTKRDKTFFFWSQQWSDQHIGNIVRGTSPTADQRNGTFTTPITDPVTGMPFPQTSPGIYQIPTGRLNSNSLALLNAVAPLPNNPGGGFQNYINDTPTINTDRDDEIKVDQNLGSMFRVMAEYLDSRSSNDNATQTFISSPFSTTREPISNPNSLAQVRLTQLISPAMVNTTSISMNNYAVSLSLTGLVNRSQVQGFQSTLPYSGALSERLPQVNFSGGWTTLGTTYQLPIVHASDLEDTVADDWSWLRGKHLIQAGMQYVFGTKRQNDFAATAGQWLFSGQFTGNPMADYLIGDAATFTQQSNEERGEEHYPIASPYVQDNWKVNHHLTVTAGFRYLYSPLPSFQTGLAMFFASRYNPANAPIVNPDGTFTPTAGFNPNNGIVLNGVTPGIPVNYSTAHRNFFNPLLGFAYDLFADGTTSVRGGFGIVHKNYFSGACQWQCSNNYPVTIPLNLITPPFPNPVGAQVAPATVPTLDSDDPNMTETNINTYSLSVEHEFRGGWIVSVTGAGNEAIHVLVGEDINQPLPEGGFDFNPIINSGTVSRYAYGERYPGYGTLTTETTPGTAKWDGLEFSARHRAGHNLFASVAYTWQKGLDLGALTTGNIQDIYHLRRDRGPDTSTPYQIFSASVVWSTPWFSHGGGLKEWVLGNWQYSDVTTFQSGFPTTIGLSTATPGLATRPNLVAGQSIGGPKTVAEWFNTNAFAAPAAGYFGNAGTGSIKGPGLVDFDMAFYKIFKITERQKVQFRSELFNTFNHTNFNGISTGFGSGNFGQITSARDPRIAEFALRYEF